ncbi:MAG: biopolymer transporter ExbD [Robiginitomaculum sp.]|nr:biopolymer transporter ExbD [Robiginitomaculum sp.]
MRRRHNKKIDSDVDMTPMLDIVFILLIFFIVTAVFVQERVISMEPPPASDEPPPPDAAPVILIQINDRNMVFVNQTLTDVRRVGLAIQRHLADNPKSSVLIVPEEEADHGTVVSALEAARISGAAAMVQRQKK